MEPNFQNIINRINQRSSEATLSLLGITQPELRQHLNDIYNQPASSSKSFLADPVFELLFGWQQEHTTMSELAGNLLEPSLVKAMDSPSKQYRDEYSFKKDWHPYRHQVKVWQKLCQDEVNSVVVTSGTGSGKTECFVVPVLNELISEFNATRQPLIGTRALFIYPLNALINSQRDRLRAWTGAFGSNLRFCLYNGNTKETVKTVIQEETPNEILSRNLLRQEPSPILVTNATMLEFMLVRQVDSPILNKSKGKLRWIVLDEAHTYIGSKAAELALLLRRVMHAFGVEAQEVRFIATSATIGDERGDEKLRSYLASIAGINEEKVAVIGGKRLVPQLTYAPQTTKTLEEIRAIDPGQSESADRYKKLSGHQISRTIRKELVSGERPKKLSELTVRIFGESQQDDPEANQKTLAWLDVCSNTINKKEDKAGEPFLPLRAHLFHQVQSGLWCCADANCKCKTGTALEIAWPFGWVYTERRLKCSCNAPVYELIFCLECNQPHLRACDVNGRLVQPATEIIDEFSLQVEDEGQEDNRVDIQNMCVLAPIKSEQTTVQLRVSKQDFTINGQVDNFPVNSCINTFRCSCCRYHLRGKRTVFRSCFLGTPFYISNTVPTLLEFCGDGQKPNESPGRGRRLITFTDSRQGTARIATKIQQDSERNRARGIVYAVAAENGTVMSPGEKTSIEKKIAEYEESVKKILAAGLTEQANTFKSLADKERQKLASQADLSIIPWTKMVSCLLSNPDISTWMLDYYHSQNPELFSKSRGGVLAEMLLLREFARRPKRQNSLETLGLVGVVYPALKNVMDPPHAWRTLGLSPDDWKSFLKLVLDFYVRQNTIIDVPKDWMNWMGIPIYPKAVISPRSDEPPSNQVLKWPQARPGRIGRLVRILGFQCNLDLDSNRDRDIINEILVGAWNSLIHNGVLGLVPATLSYRLKRDQIAFRLIDTGFICPITWRIIDSTFKKLTPYLPSRPDSMSYRCKSVVIPIYRPDLSQVPSERKRLENARSWIESQPKIAELRKKNLWTDLSDRIIEGGRYFRVAEHSAQQPASRLADYEKKFKNGKLNVLSCSTTMEMGVDIGGLSLVAMNNVPPHSANYLQRTGRAGRRGETQALGFTICKDNPHDRAVFTDPLWPFTTQVSSPYVSLDSKRIVRRHINSLALAYFFNNVMAVTEQQTTALNCGWFFYREDGGLKPVDHFIGWLDEMLNHDIPSGLKQGFRSLIIKTPFAGKTLLSLIQQIKKAINDVKQNWEPEHNRLLVEVQSVSGLKEKDPYRRRVERDLRSIQETYLLAELAVRSFLPGYGFPTGIAIFDPYSIHEFIRAQGTTREDNISRLRNKPGRDLPTALREYSPGATVVLDGLVYKSAGISLNKFSDSDIIENQFIRIEYRCAHCGHIENIAGAVFDSLCSQCGKRVNPHDSKRYLQPTGFSVDFYTSPTTDVATRSFIKVQRPWVAASDEFQSLPNPELGRFRASKDGHIFHHVSGEYDKGYAVCLRCGRAESMTETDEYPKNLRPGVHHRKLRGKPGGEGEADCDGSEGTYLIANNLHLGALDRTDVFELFLKRPSQNLYLQHTNTNDDTQCLTWTLAVVLRQALADILGINANEMGYSVKPSALSDCDYPAAGIVLFDECGGGAGFASSAPQHLVDMFQRARHYLQCSANCSSACQSCLIGHDTRYHLELLDRHVALDYLDDDFFKRLALPDHLKIFGDDTTYMYESITTAITQSDTGNLTIFLTGSPEKWDLASSPLKKFITRWSEQFNSLELVVCLENIHQLDESAREDLWVFTRLGAKVYLAPKNHGVVAQTSSDNHIMTIGSSINATSTPNAHYWHAPQQILLRSENYPKITVTSEVNSQSLKAQPNTGDKEVEIKNGLDGSISQFGKKLWRHLSDESEFLKIKLDDKDALVGLKYSDRYLYTPCTVMLIGQVLAALRQRILSKWKVARVNISTGNTTDQRGSDRGLFANWKDHQTRIRVTENYLKKYSIEASVKPTDYRDLPHGRLLELEWESGAQTTLRFDQGVGYWRYNRDRRLGILDHHDSPEQQASVMKSALRILKVKGREHPTQIFIKGK